MTTLTPLIIVFVTALGVGNIENAHAEPAKAATLAPTPSDAEGPYFKAGSPQRKSFLEKDARGDRLLVSGRVLTTAGAPISNAKLDFWQTDGNGEYDNSGFRFRGHQFTDDNGHYSLETVVPGVYPGRPPHIHVIVQAPNRPPLTTQLYILRNRFDTNHRTGQVVNLRDTPNGKAAVFDFVLDTHR